MADGDEPRRGPGRPPTTGAPFRRLTVNLQQEMITALALEAQRRGLSVSELARGIFLDWMRHEMPIGHTPLAATPDSKETPRD